MDKSISLSKSLEDYLEVIFKLIKTKGSARITDIAAAMNVAASSVNEMVAKLKKKELVQQQKYGPVKLTARGRRLAEKIDCTHEIIFKFLHELLEVDKKTADNDACLLEHSISDETLLKLINFLAKNDIIEADSNCYIDYYNLNLKEQEKMNTNRVSLDQLSRGDFAEVIKIAGSGKIKRKLMDMGLSRGAGIEIKGKAPMGDPIEVKVRGYNLSLRKEEAEKVKVKVVKK